MGTWDELASKSGLKKNVQLLFYSAMDLGLVVESKKQHEDDYTCNECFLQRVSEKLMFGQIKTSCKCVKFMNRFNGLTEINYFLKLVDW